MKVMRGAIVILPDSNETLSEGGIVLTGTMAKKQINRGKVLAVGEGEYLPTGEQIPPQIKVGDHVVYKPFQVNEIEVKLRNLDKANTDDEFYTEKVMVIKEAELLMVLDE